MMIDILYFKMYENNLTVTICITECFFSSVYQNVQYTILYIFDIIGKFLVGLTNNIVV